MTATEIPIRQELVARGMLDQVDLICRSHQVTVEELVGQGRSRRTVEARKECARWLRGPGMKWSWPEIGRLLRRSHCTVFRYFDDAERP